MYHYTACKGSTLAQSRNLKAMLRRVGCKASIMGKMIYLNTYMFINIYINLFTFLRRFHSEKKQCKSFFCPQASRQHNPRDFEPRQHVQLLCRYWTAEEERKKPPSLENVCWTCPAYSSIGHKVADICLCVDTQWAVTGWCFVHKGMF